MEERIRAKLKAIGEDYDLLTPDDKKWIEKIEALIKEKETIIQEAKQSIRECKYTTASIAKELACSRTTMYRHNGLCQRYIDYSRNSTNRLITVHMDHDAKTKIKKLEEQIALMQKRDLNEMMLVEKVQALEQQLVAKTLEVERLEQRIAKLKGDHINLDYNFNNPYNNDIS